METKLETISKKVDQEGKYEADLEQALSVAGIGWYNIKYCLVLALFLIAAIIEVIGYSYVLPAAKCDLNLLDSQRGLISSLPYVAIVITSFPWGYLVDTKGRKNVVILSTLGAGVFGILASFMPEMISFTVCKFIASLCIACPAALPYTFIGEILPQKYRDIALSVTNAMQILGSALVPLLAWGVLSLDFRIDFGSYDYRPWRLLTVVYSSFFVLSAFLMSFGPESPKYLVAQGKYDDALKVLRTMYASNNNKSPDEFPIKSLKEEKNEKNEKQPFLQSLKSQSIPLLKPPNGKWLAFTGFLLFGTFSVLNGLAMWIPDVLNRVLSGSANNGGMTACEVIAQRLKQNVDDSVCNDTIDTTTFAINSIANVICAFVALAASTSLKCIAKKTLVILTFLIIGIFCVSINFITQPYVFAALLSALPIIGLAIGPINAYAVEIFPTELRGMAVGLGMMIGRIGSVVSTNVAGLLLQATCETTFYLFGGLLIVCGILSFWLPKSRR